MASLRSDGAARKSLISSQNEAEPRGKEVPVPGALRVRSETSPVARCERENESYIKALRESYQQQNDRRPR